MISFLEGFLVEKEPTRIVVGVGGVGYEVFISLSTFDRLPAVGETCRIFTHQHVREDLLALYGFATAEERKLFLLLMGVSGIGPKLALSALSGLSVREIIAAIVQSDIKRLSSISGIGKKTAERMIVELRDKISQSEALSAGAAARKPEDQKAHDAALALVSLGYKQTDAQHRVSAALAALPADVTVEELVRKALAR